MKLSTTQPPQDGGCIEEKAEKTHVQKRVTHHFHRLVAGATQLEISEFATAIIENT